jgi:acetyl-CoA synthetase
MSAIESVLVENRVFPPGEAPVKAPAFQAWTPTTRCAMRQRDFEGFWARLARENVVWTKPFTRTLDESKAPFYKWFDDGELNAIGQLPGQAHGHAGREQDRHHL